MFVVVQFIVEAQMVKNVLLLSFFMLCTQHTDVIDNFNKSINAQYDTNWAVIFLQENVDAM